MRNVELAILFPFVVAGFLLNIANIRTRASIDSKIWEAAKESERKCLLRWPSRDEVTPDVRRFAVARNVLVWVALSLAGLYAIVGECLN